MEGWVSEWVDGERFVRFLTPFFPDTTPPPLPCCYLLSPQCPGEGCNVPILRTKCRDLKAHHGQCPSCSWRAQESDLREAVEKARREASPDEGGGGEAAGPWTCAECTYENSPGKRVCEVCEKTREKTGGDDDAPVGGLLLNLNVGAHLPKCDEHNEHVSFNGCMSCGTVFPDTWDELPDHPDSWSYVLGETVKQTSEQVRVRGNNNYGGWGRGCSVKSCGKKRGWM